MRLYGYATSTCPNLLHFHPTLQLYTLALLALTLLYFCLDLTFVAQTRKYHRLQNLPQMHNIEYEITNQG